MHRGEVRQMLKDAEGGVRRRSSSSLPLPHYQGGSLGLLPWMILGAEIADFSTLQQQVHPRHDSKLGHANAHREFSTISPRWAHHLF